MFINTLCLCKDESAETGNAHSDPSVGQSLLSDPETRMLKRSRNLSTVIYNVVV